MLQSPPLPYGKRITLLLIGFTALWIILLMAGNVSPIVGGIGGAFFLGTIVAFLIIDWSGVISLCQLIDWSRIHGKKRVWLIIAWICLSPIFFCIYVVRASMRQFGAQSTPVAPIATPIRVKVGLVVGLCVIGIGLASAFSPSSTTTSMAGSQSVAQTPTDTPVTSVAPDASTQAPVVLPTDTPFPTDTPIPTTTSSPTPTPKLQVNPTTPSQPTGVDGNPWGYNFTFGNLIYSPSTNFCDYFACIGNFWNGRGFVNECQDGDYSKSGGIRGDCSHHGGELRPLYSH